MMMNDNLYNLYLKTLQPEIEDKSYVKDDPPTVLARTSEQMKVKLTDIEDQSGSTRE